jgi:hypothetical protein
MNSTTAQAYAEMRNNLPGDTHFPSAPAKNKRPIIFETLTNIVPMSAPQAKVALWEDMVLRIITVYKLMHGVFFVAVGFGLLRLRHYNVVEILNNYVVVPYHLNPESRFVDWLLQEAETVTSHRLSILGYAAFFYAALFLTEGIGLYPVIHC